MSTQLQNLSPEVMRGLWRASPAATAATLSRAGGDRVPWDPAPHLLLLSRIIRNAVMGNGPRFNIINIPPRHGKSWLVSKWTPVWFLENWPEKRVMNCGYGSNFASEWGRLVRNQVTISQDMLTFSLAEDSKAANRWNTNVGGGMTTAGVGGDITGRGADCLIIDDPIKNAEEANSLLFRDSIWQWWTSTARTRLEPGGCIFLVMTKWHEDDLAGRLLSPEYGGPGQWNVVNLPALYDKEAAALGPDPLGRKLGQALWPERYNEEALALIQHDVGPEDWYSLFQGRPARLAGKGNVYDSFSGDNMTRIDRDPQMQLCWAIDFNRDPMCSLIAQYREELTPLSHLTNEKLIVLEVLQEMVLADCSTLDACHEFVNRTKRYTSLARGRRIGLEIYGDASGNQRSTNGDSTDWQIIRNFFGRYPEYRVTYHVPSENPAVKSRTNAVNTALCSADGFRRLYLDLSCQELKKDMLEVKWKRDTGGNTMGVIDKSDHKRTHLSDALGYIVQRKFGIRQQAGEMPGLAR